MLSPSISKLALKSCARRKRRKTKEERQCRQKKDACNWSPASEEESGIIPPQLAYFTFFWNGFSRSTNVFQHASWFGYFDSTTQGSWTIPSKTQFLGLFGWATDIRQQLSGTTSRLNSRRAKGNCRRTSSEESSNSNLHDFVKSILVRELLPMACVVLLPAVMVCGPDQKSKWTTSTWTSQN